MSSEIKENTYNDDETKLLPCNLRLREQRYRLWEHMEESYGLALLESEIDEIINLIEA